MTSARLGSFSTLSGNARTLRNYVVFSVPTREVGSGSNFRRVADDRDCRGWGKISPKRTLHNLPLSLSFSSQPLLVSPLLNAGIGAASTTDLLPIATVVYFS